MNQLKINLMTSLKVLKEKRIEFGLKRWWNSFDIIVEFDDVLDIHYFIYDKIKKFLRLYYLKNYLIYFFLYCFVNLINQSNENSDTIRIKLR